MPARSKRGSPSKSSPSKSKSKSRSRSPSRGDRSERKNEDGMSTLLKLVPALQDKGFDKWLKGMQLAGFNNNWYEDGIFFSTMGWQPSDMPALADATSPKERERLRRHRKHCYTLIMNTCEAMAQHFEGVPIGDVSALYAQITQVYTFENPLLATWMPRLISPRQK